MKYFLPPQYYLKTVCNGPVPGQYEYFAVYKEGILDCATEPSYHVGSQMIHLHWTTIYKKPEADIQISDIYFYVYVGGRMWVGLPVGVLLWAAGYAAITGWILVYQSRKGKKYLEMCLVDHSPGKLYFHWFDVHNSINGTVSWYTNI